jgi:hypothetical protein
MNWRIYRLPGSREIWHVDSGQGTTIFNVRGFASKVMARSVDIGGDNVPRAWIEISGCELHIVNGIARFETCRHALRKSEVAVSIAETCKDKKVEAEQ